MTTTKIEFYGEYLSIEAIGKKIGVSKNTVKRYYDRTHDIYETERICKEILEKKEKNLIEYTGEKLTIGAIAKKEGVKDPKTLKRYYEQEKDIYKAVEKYKNSQIEYYGEYLTLHAIAKKEGIKSSTLQRYYDREKDIYQAVKKYKKMAKQRKDAKVEYNGEIRTITSIAKELEKVPKTLRKYYKQTGDIYKSIELCEQKEEERELAKVEYNGERKTIIDVAKQEEIPTTTLYRNYHKYKDINKAVFISKIYARKAKTDKQKEENTNKENTRKYDEVIYMSDGQTLREYCMKNEINYRIIYEEIKRKKRTPEEAIEDYQKRGQKSPTYWVHEKYNVLLKHILIQYHIDSNAVLRYMKKENKDIEEAVEKYIVRHNARTNKLNSEWMEEIYNLLKDEEVRKEYEIYKDTFYIDNKEEECLKETQEQVKSFRRNLLLFEIADMIESNSFSREEEADILSSYKITSDEIDTIFLDLYGQYDGKVLMGGKEEKLARKRQLNDIIKKWYYLGQKDRENAIKNYNITEEELGNIQDISNKMIRYKNIVTTKREEKTMEK